MVGRLVEQQQFRAAHQGLREVEAHAPATGEFRDRARELAGGETEAGEQRWPRVPAPCSRPCASMLACAAATAHGRRAHSSARCRSRSAARNAVSPSSTNSMRGLRQSQASPARRRRCASAAAGRSRLIPDASSPRSRAKRLDLPLPLARRDPTRQPGCSCSVASSIRRRAPRAKRKIAELNHAAVVCACGGRAF